jgi:hypothetical protein
LADVNPVAASSVQGTLVHGTNTEQTAAVVTGNLGSNGPNIVNFSADTNGPGDLLRLQDGQGQADVTGAEITLGGTPNDVYDIMSGNIWLTGNLGMQDIEFGLTSGMSGTIDFTITALAADGVTPETFHFDNLAIGEGDTFYAFLASAGEVITNVAFSVDSPPGSITLIKQVRIDVAQGQALPEPATWAMMLLGFGATGFAMRRSRRKALLTQIA